MPLLRLLSQPPVCEADPCDVNTFWEHTLLFNTMHALRVEKGGQISFDTKPSCALLGLGFVSQDSGQAGLS